MLLPSLSSKYAVKLLIPETSSLASMLSVSVSPAFAVVLFSETAVTTGAVVSTLSGVLVTVKESGFGSSSSYFDSGFAS